MRLLGFALVALALSACTEETIVLATVPEGEEAGTTPRRVDKLRCFTTADCLDGDYCNKERCDSREGRCFHKPLSCEKDVVVDPICGCTSGITYLNECHRRQAGEESGTRGECEENARTCDGIGKLCPTGTTCQLLGLGPPASPACGLPMGRCWGIISCPPATKGEWTECSTEPGALKCVDTCTAIQTGRKFTREPCKGP